MDFNDIYMEYKNKINQFFTNKRIDEIKDKSQYFTPISQASKLFENININKYSVISILDPACGGGILVIKLIEQILNIYCPKKIFICLCDIDKDAIELTKTTINLLECLLKEKGIELEIKCTCADFLREDMEYEFDYIVMNPPYRKIKKINASEKLTVFINGQPNLYHLFIVKSLNLLKENGVLCIISPKNYLSGRYTEKLREKIISDFSISKIHTLNNRNSIFDYKITQEICMVHIKRSAVKKVIVSYNGFDSFIIDKKELIVNEKTNIILTPRHKKDVELLSKFKKFPQGIIGKDILMKTGKVVQFRVNNKEKVLISDKYEYIDGGLPLIIYGHINSGEFDYRKIEHKKADAITMKNDGLNDTLLIDNKNYIFMRKATDKKYEKLILCVPYLKDLSIDKIAIDNGLVYFERAVGDFTENEIKGINCILMSKQFDDYYRMYNSTNTINVYEFENMNFPDLDMINLIGSKIQSKLIDVEKATDIFSEFLK